MLENTVANGERPAELIVYGGSGRAARNWECFHAIVAALKGLGDDETLVIQSGKPVAVFRTSPMAPKVLTANTNLVGKWATWPVYRALEAKGLIMYGQYTAGTWAYIGTQGILQGTYETFAAAGKRFPSGDLRGRIVLTAGLGGMGGAQPLAVKMAGGVCIAVEVDPARAERRVAMGYCDVIVHDATEAMRLARDAAAKGETLGIALIGNAAEMFPRSARMGLAPAVVTDQTSAHDPLNGYVPAGYSLAEAVELRARDPDRYVKDGDREHRRGTSGAMLAFQDDGAIVFEYGNNIRGQAEEAGEARAFEIEGFVPLFIRPSFAIGRGTVPLGLPVRRPGGPRGHRRGGARRVPRRRRCSRRGWRWRASACRSRACRRARAGSASASATAWGSSSTGSSATASSRGRSPCRATISTPARWRSRPARPRR